MLELKVGQIYQKKGTLDVRTIKDIWTVNMCYFDIGGTKIVIERGSFRRWLRRNKIEKPIGEYDFEEGKAKAVK